MRPPHLTQPIEEGAEVGDERLDVESRGRRAEVLERRQRLRHEMLGAASGPASRPQMQPAGKLHEALDRYGIANQFDVYPGTHTSRVADRIQNHVMPFFGRSLCFDAGCR